MDSGLVTQHASSYSGSHGLREYRLVIYPDSVLYTKLMAEKRRFYINYGVDSALKCFPYIMVSCFYAREGMEETLIRWIQRISSRYPGFPVELNNFSGFPDHTVFLRVQDPQPLTRLVQQLKAIDHYIQLPVARQGKNIQPFYLSIATGLTAEVYRKAMPAYSRKTFHACFHAKEMVLLARDHPFAVHKTVTVFRFLPVSKQSYTEVA